MMFDETHPFRGEKLEYLNGQDILNRSPWYTGMLFETEKELICFKPELDYLIVIDRSMLLLSFLEDEISN